MPIYEYQCKSCDNKFEKLVFAGDQEPISCPKCDSKDVEKQMSATSFMKESGMGACVTPPGGGFS